ncbi:MAG: hypothetical protein O3A51_14735 [Verrucomicrobia bacterium]|nr:hypothetical protein [Verrucomicrobiota bacterium]
MIIPSAGDAPTAQPIEAGNFPIVDLSGIIAGEAGAVERAAEELRANCENAAFFFVRNHGVPQTLIDGILSECARFHAQPLDDKLKVKMSGDIIGYLPPGSQTQRTSIYNKNTKRELSASYYLRRDYPADHPDRVAGAPWVFDNRWPDTKALPGFREEVLAYFAALDGLTGILLQLFSAMLGMGPRYMVEHQAFSPPSPTLRLLEYQPQDPDEENLFGIGPHSDYGCITILNQGTSPGLEVLLPSGEWARPPLLPGHFLINTGQLLSRWCNDRIPATPHRVINSTGGVRHSVAFLIGTSPDVILDCLPSCQGPNNPAKYPPISYGDHIAAIRRQNYDVAQDGTPETDGGR